MASSSEIIAKSDVEFGEDIDETTFEQILDMDDDEGGESHEFSSSIVFGFFEQAQTTFKDMDTAMENKDLPKLSALGHFLKGSSATLGFTKVKDECEKIQNYGHLQDETGTSIKDPDKALTLIGESLAEAKKCYVVVERKMNAFYKQID